MASVSYEMYADNTKLWGVCMDKHRSIILDNPKKIFKKIKLENYIRTCQYMIQPYYICINSYAENKSYKFYINDEGSFQHVSTHNYLICSDEHCMVVSIYMFQKLQKILDYLL
jgi:hypothetical protein